MGNSAGVVTLLFTDLVASTELLARVGDDAAEDLRRVHFDVLRTAIGTSGGQEVKTLGDGQRGPRRLSGKDEPPARRDACPSGAGGVGPGSLSRG
ncbi:MAG: hypothetical protein ACRDYF_03305 [Acidimicrobiia bacterium]